jgi:hypothetical protein
MMRSFIPRLSGACAAAVLLGAVSFLPPAALAQAAAPAPAAAPAAKAKPAAKATPVSRVEARIKSLHATLQITAAQEPLWQPVADAMRDDAKTVGALIEERESKEKTMTAADDLHAYSAIADAHAAGVKKLAAAFDPLYAALSDAQKKKADAAFRRRPRPSQPKKSG